LVIYLSLKSPTDLFEEASFFITPVRMIIRAIIKRRVNLGILLHKK